MTAASVSSETRPTPLTAVSVETVGYLVVLLVALILRSVALGAVPLSEPEARQALAAQHLVDPMKPALGQIDNPVTFTGLVLTIGAMGASDGAARFIPMLAGVLLVFTPILFRTQLGKLPTLVASSLLAVSPVAVGISRIVGGLPFAALAFMIALGGVVSYFRTTSPRAVLTVGIAIGIAVIADYTTLLTLIALGLGTVFALFTEDDKETVLQTFRERSQQIPWLTLIITILVTFFIIGSLFFFAPEGLGAGANQFGRFVQGLSGRVPGAAWPGISLMIYEPGLIIFALAGVWLTSQSTLLWQRLLAGWGFASLLIFLIYPGALPGHTIWVVLPFVGLAALTLATMLSLQPQAPQWASWVHGAIVIAFFGMIFASLSQYLTTPHMLAFPFGADPSVATAQIPIDLVLIAAWILLLVVLWLMVASMWEPAAAWRGLGLGLIGIMILLSIGQASSLAFNRANSAYEPLHLAPAQPGLTELVKTLDEIATLTVGNPADPTITVQGAASDTLIWALRNQSKVNFMAVADPTIQSAIVITPSDGADPALGSSYVGQDFLIVRQWQPQGLSANDFVKWLLYRTAPTPAIDQKVILWVREDIYRLVQAGGTPGQ